MCVIHDSLWGHINPALSLSLIFIVLWVGLVAVEDGGTSYLVEIGSVEDGDEGRRRRYRVLVDLVRQRVQSRCTDDVAVGAAVGVQSRRQSAAASAVAHFRRPVNAMVDTATPCAHHAHQQRHADKNGATGYDVTPDIGQTDIDVTRGWRGRLHAVDRPQRLAAIGCDVITAGSRSEWNTEAIAGVGSQLGECVGPHIVQYVDGVSRRPFVTAERLVGRRRQSDVGESVRPWVLDVLPDDRGRRRRQTTDDDDSRRHDDVDADRPTVISVVIGRYARVITCVTWRRRSHHHHSNGHLHTRPMIIQWWILPKKLLWYSSFEDLETLRWTVRSIMP